MLFVHQDPSLASSRVRVLELVPHLEARGIRCEVARYPGHAIGLRALIDASQAVDAIVLQKKLPAWLDVQLWGRRSAPLVYDFDDAVMLGQAGPSPTRRRRFAAMLELADAFVAGSEGLASHCRGRGAPVAVIPSAVPVEVPRAEARLPSAMASPGEPVRIAWIGSRVNLGELEPVAPVIERLAQGRSLELVVICDAAPELPLREARLRHVPWRLETQTEELARCHLGIMPLADTPWSRGKCAYKLLQYLAAGLPAVASPVGANAEVVVDGENALLASGAAQWTAALQRLLVEPGLAERLAAAGPRTVAARFSREQVADRWAAFLGEIAG